MCCHSEVLALQFETLRQMNIHQINMRLPDDLDQAYQDAMARRRTLFEFQHRLASGEVRDVEVHNVPIHTSGQTLLYSIIHDISDRSQIEEALRASETLYRTVLHTAMDGFWLADLQGNLLEVNGAYCRMSGTQSGNW